MGLPFNKIETFLGMQAVGNKSGRHPGGATFVIDSRRVRPGHVFIAVKGENHDGHDFINRRIINRAALLIVNRSWFNRSRPAAGCFIVVPDTVKAMLKMTKAYLGFLGLKVMAITGSNGKTTTRTMVAKVLKAKYRVYESMANFNNRIGLPLSVFEMDRSHDIAVLEMGANHFGEIRELSETVRPDISLITNIGRGHLEFFRTRKGVLRAKTEIVKGMKKGGILAVNGDDPLLNGYRPPPGIKKISYGFQGKRTCRGADPATGLLSGTTFKLGKGMRVAVDIPGMGAAYNALGALCMGNLLGIPLKKGIKALKTVQAPKDRMLIKRIHNARVVLDCYNANPDSLNNVLSLIKQETGAKRKIAILGNMAELGKKGAALHRQAGRFVKQCGFHVLLTLGRMGKEIANGAKQAGMRNIFSFMDRDFLAAVIKKSIRPGDLMLLKASRSMRMDEVADKILKRKQG